MSGIIGRGRNARETYPQANAALSGFYNRFLIGSGAPPGIPDAFTSAAPVPLAAVNFTRRASGIFQLSAQIPITLAGADASTVFQASSGPGTTTGGVLFEDWLIADGVPLVVPVPTGILGFNLFAVAAGNLVRTVTLTGCNSVPVPQGAGTIFISGRTAGPTLLTPDGFLASVYELP